MFSIISMMFEKGTTIAKLLSYMETKKKKTKGRKNKILFEIEFNMKLIFEFYLEKGADAKKIISNLKIKDLAEAIGDGFDFQTITKGEINENITSNVGFFKHYVGYDCEALLKNIRFHIEQLTSLPNLFDDIEKTKQINVKRRLHNLGKRYILFMKLLKAN